MKKFFCFKKKHLNQTKKPYRRYVAILLTITLLFSFTAPVFATALTGNTPKQEVVYINLDSDGSVRNIYVVNIFELNEDGQIIDYGNYTALRNMTTKDEIVFKDETVKIDTKAGKLYYEGTLDKEIIPWDFKIRYYLDGTEYPAQKLAGKSGALKILMSVRQNQWCNSTFFDHYSLQASFFLDAKHCKNIVADGATVVNAGADRQLTYTILAGNEKDMVITADVTNFEMDGIAINGVSLNMDVELDTGNHAELNQEINNLEDAVAKLDDGAKEVKDGADDLLNGAGELKNGATALQDGVFELFDGAVELRDGATALSDGAIDLDHGARELQNGAGALSSGANDLMDGAAALRDGTAECATGAQELTDGMEEAVDGALALHNGISKIKDGADDLYSGADFLYNGLHSLDRQSDTLLHGAYSVFEELTAQAAQQVNSSLTAAGMATVDLTPENYAAVLSDLLDTLSGGASTQAAAVVEGNIRTQVASAIENDAEILAQIDTVVERDYGTIINTEAQSYVAVAFAKNQCPDNPEEWLQSAEGQTIVAAYLSSPEGQSKIAAAGEQIKVQYVEAAIAQQIEAAVAEQLASDEVQAQISEAVSSALGTNEAYRGVIALKAQLDNYNAFYLGLQQYTTGVGTATDGAYDLLGGASVLSDGADDLYAGMETLYHGLLELQRGSAALRSGTITLHDGAMELYNGVLELKDGTTELLNGTIELKDGTAELLHGVMALKDGTITLYDGVVVLQDGVIELLDGAIELYDGTVELHQGTVELKDGTFEFRDKTAHLDKDLKDKINEAIRDMLGGEFEIFSFVSDKNTNVESVQFVIKTDGIGVDAEKAVVSVVEQPLTFWQKLLRLFGLY